jgi:hypothetical protein
MPSLSEAVSWFLNLSAGLSPVQLWFVIALAFILLLYLAYRTMGLGGLFGILLVGFFAYVLLDHDTFGSFRQSEDNKAGHMSALEAELEAGN